MTEHRMPKQPIPEPLRGSDEGSFAQQTVTERLPRIIQETLDSQDFQPRAKKRLEDLHYEIPHGRIRLLDDPRAPDLESWQSYIAPNIGLTWLQVPWFFAETYMYRRILEATGYYQPGAGRNKDPFREQKRDELEASLPEAEEISELLSEWYAEGPPENAIVELLVHTVWGNRGDLSMWPERAGEATDLQAEEEHLLVNDSEQTAAHIQELGSGTHLDFLSDNVGLELIFDLVLADFLLRQQHTETIVFHLKYLPTFVSDATIEDVYNTLGVLLKQDSPSLQKLAERMQEAVEQDRLILKDHPYWNSPLAGWEMPERLHRELSAPHLIISKGDAHYRRLLGDRHWPYTTPLPDVLRYVPSPLVAMRVLKSEVAAGLDEETKARAQKEDEDWLVSGKWGMIQFYHPDQG